MDGMTADFLLNASLLYKDRCPELSRFLLQSPMKYNPPPSRKLSGLLQDAVVCPYCCQWLQPDNHRVRLRPKRRPSTRVQRVLLREARGKWLSPVQRNMLRRFRRSSSTLMATCHTCTKTSRHKGMNRDFIATFSRSNSTPGSAGKHKTPQLGSRSNSTTPKTPGKTKTPVNTPRSSVCSSSSSSTPTTGSSSSKPQSKPKNWVVQRLSKILMREDKQGNKKGGLKDFLSSL